LNSENLNIRRFKTRDFEEVAEIWKKTDLGRPERGDDLRTILKSLEIGGRFLILEKKDIGRIIGTSWMTFDGRRLHLHHFGIHPEFQGMGFAKPLLLESLKFAKEKNIQIKLEVHKENRAAISLYKKFGFEYLGDYDIYIIRNFKEIDSQI
jgi:ribosomal protein S18 acetylase RimI-like enzyme